MLYLEDDLHGLPKQYFKKVITQGSGSVFITASEMD
jgi:hypothetical protein